MTPAERFSGPPTATGTPTYFRVPGISLKKSNIFSTSAGFTKPDFALRFVLLVGPGAEESHPTSASGQGTPSISRSLWFLMSSAAVGVALFPVNQMAEIMCECVRKRYESSITHIH